MTQDVERPSELVLHVGSARPFRLNVKGSRGQVADLSTVTAARFTILDGDSVVYTKLAEDIDVTNGRLTFEPSQAEADAWDPGRYVCGVSLKFGGFWDKIDDFNVEIRASSAENEE